MRIKGSCKKTIDALGTVTQFFSSPIQAEIEVSPEELARQMSDGDILNLMIGLSKLNPQECSCEKPNYYINSSEGTFQNFCTDCKKPIGSDEILRLCVNKINELIKAFNSREG